jgi:cysteine desulfurase family protein (TIGR01976 family)
MTTAVAATRSSVASVEEIRAAFPALARRHRGQPVAYFDGPGGTQVPRVVADAVSDYLLHHNANTHWHYPTSIETDEALAAARVTLADFLGADPSEIAFGANMTTLTYHLSRALARAWGPGDEIVVTELDHHANVDTWRALERDRGLTVRTVPLNPAEGRLDDSALVAAIGPRTKLVAVGAASNALGTINDLRRVGELARAQKALFFVDAVHYAAHAFIDVRKLGCDFLACSAYKFYGPHVGVLYGRRELVERLEVPRLEPASDESPERLETGTIHHEGVVGAAAAVDFLASLAPGASRRERLATAVGELHRRGEALLARLWNGLAAIGGVKLYGRPPGEPRTPTVGFTVKGVSCHDVARSLSERALFLSSGDFYALTVVRRLGLAHDGLVRAGCACYTTADEVDRLLEGVRAIATEGT